MEKASNSNFNLKSILEEKPVILEIKSKHVIINSTLLKSIMPFEKWIVYTSFDKGAFKRIRIISIFDTHEKKVDTSIHYSPIFNACFAIMI